MPGCLGYKSNLDQYQYQFNDISHRELASQRLELALILQIFSLPTPPSNYKPSPSLFSPVCLRRRSANVGFGGRRSAVGGLYKMRWA